MQGKKHCWGHTLLCPQCDVPVHISGMGFIIIGLFLWLPTSVILCRRVQVLGVIAGLTFGALGMMRLVRQFRRRLKFNKAKRQSKEVDFYEPRL